MKQSWGFIGCGNLAQAIIAGAVAKKTLQPRQIMATNRSPSKLAAFSKRTKIRVVKTNSDLVDRAQIIVLATKPQDILLALSEIKEHVTPKHIIISLAAGVETSIIRKHLPRAGSVIRVMANTPAKIQQGVFGIYFHQHIHKTSPQTKKQITHFFSKLGLAIELKNEDQINAITAASASGAGFVFEFIRIFESWLKSQGISDKSANQVAIQTFFGSASFALQSPQESLESLRNAVTSKKGTTLSGLRSMKAHKLENTIKGGLKSASQRAKVISKSLRQR